MNRTRLPSTPAVLALGFAASLALAAEPSFRPVTVDPQIAIGYGLALADVDGDRRTDIVLCDKNQIVWYQNPGWQKHVIAEKLTALDHVCVAAADIDGDGRAEIAAGAGWNPGDTRNSGALFLLQPGADRTRPWTPIPLPHAPTIHRIRWVKDHAGRMSLVSAPLHGRGNDPGKGEGEGVRIQRYSPPSQPGSPWPTEILDAAHHKTHNLDPVEWDGDPAHEILLASREGAFLVDPGAPASPAKVLQLCGDENGGIGEIRGGQFAPGRRFVAGISPMHGNQLVLLTPGKDAGAPWTRRVLDENLADGHALVCADFLGLGRDQIAVGWRAMNRPGVKVGIKLFIPLDPEGREWRSVLVDDNGMACEDLQAADLDGDGRLDLVAAGRATRNVKVYFNQSGTPAK